MTAQSVSNPLSPHIPFVSPSSLRNRISALFALVGAAVVPVVLKAQVDDQPVLASFREDIELTMDQFCYDCHGYGGDKGGVVLDGFETDGDLMDHDLWLRVLNNLRKGVMPPSDEAQPSHEEREAIVEWIKHKAFQLDPADPDPGTVTVRRLNRTEYRNTIRDLMGVDYNTMVEFPADDTGHGFDNIADVLSISPILLEKYLDAAQTIVGQAVPTQSRVVAESAVPGRQFVSTVEIAPVEEEMVVEDVVAAAALAEDEEGDDAMPDALVWQAGTIENDALDLVYYNPASVAATATVEHEGDYKVVVDLRAVERHVNEQFDLNEARLVFKLNDEILLDREFAREGSRGFVFEYDQHLPVGEHELKFELYPLEPAQPQLRNLRVRVNAVTLRGPMADDYWVQPAGYTEFFPRPVPADEAAQDAYRKELLRDFAAKAFRRPVDDSTVNRLARVAATVSAGPGGTFESGVAQAMVAVLASPRFLFREEALEPLADGERFALVDEYSLASRLSYFLWSSMPDQELFDLAEAGALRENLSAQVKRMLADPRSDQLVDNFTGQWLQARDVGDVPISDFEVFLRDNPNPELVRARILFQKLREVPDEERTPEQEQQLREAQRAFRGFFRTERPRFTRSIKEAMRDETEMYFDYILREDRSLLELIDSDYTFLNEELATHYGDAGLDVKGEEMRRVVLPAGSPRGGVLTQGTVLAVTSNPTRTSPVKRGVFILDNILGAPPPPPPPDIPPLEDVEGVEDITQLSLRETLELHASQKLCASCHLRMDPLGLALENFNAMGAWREQEMGKPIEPEGVLISGGEFNTIQELKQVLLRDHSDDFLHTITERMMTYALGREMKYYDVETIDQIVHRLEANDARMSVLLTSIIESSAFQKSRVSDEQLARMRAEPESETDQLATLSR